MMKNQYQLLSFLILFSFFLHSCYSIKKQKNVLMIIVDDLRPEIGAWGNEHIITPSLDKLSEEGFSFRNAFSQYANCSPSRISLMTGLSPETLGHTGNLRSKPKFSKHITLPRHFKNNGYFTASIGKIYHDAKDDSESWDYFYDLVGPDKPWTDPSNRWECYVDSMNNQLYGHDRPAVEKSNKSLNSYKDFALCEKAMEILSKQKDNKFFVALGFRKPHLPFAAPYKYWELYDRDNISQSEHPMFPINADTTVYKWSELSAYNYFKQNYETSNYQNRIIDQDKARQLRHGYFACVSFIDNLVGKIMHKLEELDLSQNTIVVVMGDHGFQLGDQQIWGKHSNFRLSTRVPLIIYDPSLDSKSQKSDEFVELLDIFPTLSEIASLPKPINVDGKSFANIFHGANGNEYKFAYSQYQSFQKNTNFSTLMSYAIHEKNHTYIEWQDVKENFKVVNRELYEFDDDKIEKVNISGYPQYADIIMEFSKNINLYFKRHRLKAETFK